MTNTVNLRAVVLDILMGLEKEGTFSHLVMGNALTKYQYLNKTQRSFITRVAQGTIEKRIELDYVINQFSKTPVRKMKPLIRNLLEMSVYQLIYMDAVPASAVCNEAVKLAVKRSFGNLRGFVNGVLRNISRNLDKIVYPDPQKDQIQYLSVHYSMPEWIIKMWMETYKSDIIEQILAGFNENRKTYIRCNTKKTSPEQLKAELINENVTVKEVTGLPYAFEISGYDYLSDLESFQNGEFQVQDISSMLAGQAAAPQPDARVIDVCAAPGGKSINISFMLEQGSVEARDLTDYKASLIESNVERLEIDNVSVKVWDATKLDETSVEKADLVIADLPCSGLGIIGRKPDIKYHLTPEKLAELAKLQKEILNVVWQYVRPGGVLLYSTCTINKEENEENVKWFCKNYPFELVTLEQQFNDYADGRSTENGLQLLPGTHGTDGFFIAKLKRKEEA